MPALFQDDAKRVAASAGARRVPARVALAVLPIAFLVTQLGGALVRGVVLNLFPADLIEDLAGPVATLVAMGTTSVLLLFLALGIPVLFGVSVRRVFEVRSAPWPVFVAAAVGTVALGPLADLLMASMAAWQPNWTFGSVSMLHGLAQRFPAVILWPFFALLPGLAEETFFRGLLQRSFRHSGIAVMAGGGTFALFHVDPHHIVGVLPLGLFLSWVAQQHGLLVTIVAHVVNNTVALCSAQVAGLDIGYGTETPLPFYWVPVGLVVAALAMGILRPAATAEAQLR